MIKSGMNFSISISTFFAQFCQVMMIFTISKLKNYIPTLFESFIDLRWDSQCEIGKNKELKIR